MRANRSLLIAAIAVSLAGCMQTQSPMISSRSAPNAITANVATEEARMAEQTTALTRMTRDIIRKSTVNGAALGALAGCGLAVVSAGNAKNCISAVVVGGAVGAIAGNAAGQKQAKNRVELVSPSALVRSIGKANNGMSEVRQDLPKLLATQDAELKTLNAQLKSGDITEKQFSQRFEVIKANRSQLAEALSLSAAQANEAHRNLQSAQSKGQTGLDWHLSATKNLARNATSARSAISLL